MHRYFKCKKLKKLKNKHREYQKYEQKHLLQRVSSDPSVQSNLPSQTSLFGIQSPFEQVAWSRAHAVGGRVGGGTSVKQKHTLH